MKANIENPVCVKCGDCLKKNGTVNGKRRFRCSRCGYNETEDSIAHNRNVRTFYGFNKASSSSAFSVYMIECLTPFHYYIGLTTQLEHRILAHKKGLGSTFTKKHGFKQLINVIHCSNHEEASSIEKSLTLFYALKYGKANVCGYCWTNSIGHEKEDLARLPKSFGSVGLERLRSNERGFEAHECKFEPSQNMKANGSSVVGDNPIQVRGSITETRTEKNQDKTNGKSVSIPLGLT